MASSEEATDTELMLRLRNADEGALAELYERFAPKLYSLALRIVWSREEAEEVVQDVFIKLYRKPRLYRPELASPAAYLNTITRNTAVSHLRKHKRRPAQSSLDAMPERVAAAEGPTDRIMAGEMLDQVSAEERALLNDAFFKGYSHGELAERTGLLLGTVKTKLRRALHKLRRYVEEP